MDRLLKQHARRRRALKRGSDWVRVPLDPDAPAKTEVGDRVEAFCLAMERIRQADPKMATLLHMVSLEVSQTEIAEHLNVSTRKVREDIAIARVLLRSEMDRVS